MLHHKKSKITQKGYVTVVFLYFLNNIITSIALKYNFSVEFLFYNYVTKTVSVIIQKIIYCF